MWKHEIIEALDNEKQHSSKQRADYLLSVRSKVTGAEFFYFGEMEGLRETFVKEYARKTYMFEKFPYPFVVYEFENNAEKIYKINRDGTSEVLGTHKTKTAYLVEQKAEESLSVIVFAKTGCDSWFIGPLELLVERNQTNGGDICVRNISDMKFEEVEDLQQATVFGGWQAMTLNKIVMCQNVVTRDVIPPEKLNRKRIRKGRLPLYSYKILEVVKGKPKTKNAGSVPWDYKSPEAVRFHLCRGHFKTYNEDSKLFGKYTGTFWWNPQSRGDRSKGVVEKEYNVKQVN